MVLIEMLMNKCKEVDRDRIVDQGKTKNLTKEELQLSERKKQVRVDRKVDQRVNQNLDLNQRVDRKVEKQVKADRKADRNLDLNQRVR